MRPSSRKRRGAPAKAQQQKDAEEAAVQSMGSEIAADTAALAAEPQEQEEVRRIDDEGSLDSPELPQGKSVVIRQMELKDLSAAFALGSSLFTSERAATLYRTWDEFEVGESFYDCPELCLVAELAESAPEVKGKKDDKSRIVGFVLASVLEKNHKAICGYLQWVAVKQTLHRKHIGTRLVHAVLDRMAPRNVHQVLADTPMVNTDALGFFKAMDFAEPEPHIYLHRNMHGDGELLDAKHQASIKLEIRTMVLADLYAVFELGCELFSPEFNTLHRTWTEDEVVAFLLTDSDNCLVAHVDDELVGFVLGTIVEKRVWHYGYLTWMGVSRKIQRGGVGKLMFQAFHDTVLEQGANMMLVDTQRTNTPAIQFFEKCGFKRDEDSEHCYFVRSLQDTDKTALAVPKPLLGHVRGGAGRASAKRWTNPESVISGADQSHKRRAAPAARARAASGSVSPALPAAAAAAAVSAPGGGKPNRSGGKGSSSHHRGDQHQHHSTPSHSHGHGHHDKSSSRDKGRKHASSTGAAGPAMGAAMGSLSTSRATPTMAVSTEDEASHTDSPRSKRVRTRST